MIGRIVFKFTFVGTIRSSHGAIGYDIPTIQQIHRLQTTLHISQTKTNTSNKYDPQFKQCKHVFCHHILIDLIKIRNVYLKIQYWRENLPSM